MTGRCTLGLALISLPTVLWAQRSPVADAVRALAKDKGRALVAAAEAMPAAKYGFRATRVQMSFGQLVLHIEQDNRETCGALSGLKPAPEGTLTAAASKDRLVEALRRSVAFCDSALATVGDAALADPVTYYGETAPRAVALISLVDDWADHYSLQAVYLRLNGVLPPTARRGGT